MWLLQKLNCLCLGGLILTETVGKDFNDGEESFILRMLQAVAVPVLGNVCHVFMHGLNRVQVLKMSGV